MQRVKQFRHFGSDFSSIDFSRLNGDLEKAEQTKARPFRAKTIWGEYGIQWEMQRLFSDVFREKWGKKVGELHSLCASVQQSLGPHDHERATLDQKNNAAPYLVPREPLRCGFGPPVVTSHGLSIPYYEEGARRPWEIRDQYDVPPAGLLNEDDTWEIDTIRSETFSCFDDDGEATLVERTPLGLLLDEIEKKLVEKYFNKENWREEWYKITDEFGDNLGGQVLNTKQPEGKQPFRGAADRNPEELFPVPETETIPFSHWKDYRGGTSTYPPTRVTGWQRLGVPRAWHPRFRAWFRDVTSHSRVDNVDNDDNDNSPRSWSPVDHELGTPPRSPMSVASNNSPDFS
ncbi:unnamed protein product [Amoebophrya sp. A120]|nr:unnamed protein product [Amoebophrya sp. A120]|eukprot:GSA120T00014825001.1